MRLIADGVIDRDGVKGLASALAVSERHLHRLLITEVGAGPLAIARAHRAQTARTLIETTPMKFADVAFAAGFSSIRQFNDTMRDVFAQSPSDLRNRVTSFDVAEPGEVTVRLPFRTPYQVSSLYAWVAHREIAGLQWVEGEHIHRTLRLPNGPASARLRFEADFVSCSLALGDVRDLATAVERCRRFLDLDADPCVIDEALATDPVLRPLVRADPGVRAPGSVDGFETAVFAIVGQQVSVRAACAAMGKLVAQHGEPVAGGRDAVAFPAPERLARAELSSVGLTTRSSSAIREVAALVSAGTSFDPGADRRAVRDTLLAVHGIGPWTADYVALRALRDPDVLPVGDLAIRQAAEHLGLDPSQKELTARGQAWSPWRTYAAHHLWAADRTKQEYP